jgi:hypothetical protein
MARVSDETDELFTSDVLGIVPLQPSQITGVDPVKPRNQALPPTPGSKPTTTSLKMQSAAFALGRRNWLFAGSHSGGERAAAIYSILQTAKLNGVNPEAYLTDTLSRIAAGHPISRISELMPWAFRSPPGDPAA